MKVAIDVLSLMLIKESLCRGCVSINCSNIDTFECYAIDENGYVVISNQGKSYNGVFLGYINGRLLDKLVNEEIYIKHIFKDTKGQCQEDVYEADTTSGINTLTNTFEYTTLMFRIFFKQILQFITLIIMTSKQYASSHDAAMRYVSCTKLLTVYQRSNQTINLAGTFYCTKQCQESYSVVWMQDTNLILVITTKECGGKCLNYAVNIESIKVPEGDVCDNTQTYRKPTPKCYSRIEDHGECYSNSYQMNSHTTIMLLSIVVAIIYNNVYSLI